MPFDYVIGALKRCVNPSSPWVPLPGFHDWKFEVKRFPIGIEAEIDMQNIVG